MEAQRTHVVRLKTIFAVTAILLVFGPTPGVTDFRCETLTIPMCQGLGYTETVFPNLLGQALQDEAGLDFRKFWPLVKIECSPLLKWFLCQVYAPPCDASRAPIKPCRSMCEAVRDGCVELMNMYGFEWPGPLNCENFPINYTEEPCREV